MLMVDLQRQRLSHFHTRDPDLRIEHNQADGGADKDEVGFELGHGSREEEIHVSAGWRGLADLQVEL
jgi:predicted cupin superfamily sugar epimerase